MNNNFILCKRKKLILNLFFLSLSFLILITLINAVNLGDNDVKGVNIIPATPGINYSLVNVNNSQFLQGYTPTNLPVCYYNFGTNNFNGSGSFVTSGVVNTSDIRINSSTLKGSILVYNTSGSLHLGINGTSGRILMLGAIFSSVSGSSSSGTALLGSSSPTISTPRIAQIYGGTATTSNLTLTSTTVNGTAKGGNVFFQTNSSITTRNMIIDNLGNVNITRGNLDVEKTINTNKNFSIRNNIGITNSFNMLNATNSSCYMNFTGGILTWSDC